MFGKRKAKSQKQGENKLAKGTGGKCICSQCGYSNSHQRGVPCFTLICPTCKIPLTRQDNSGNKFPNNNENKKSNVNSFPDINIDLCAGCGACVKACLSGAIVIENRKAKIKKENCIKCLICIDACPAEAIS